MHTIFNLDGPLFSFLSKVANLAILNILWMICCIPIFTIGAATTALFLSTIRLTNDTDSYVIKFFFKTFINNFKRSTIVWLILLVIGIILGADCYIFYNEIIGSKLFFYVSLPFVALYIFVLIYIFPVIAVYNNTVKNAFRNALFFSITQLPSTLFMCALPFFIFLMSTDTFTFFQKYGFLFWLILGFSFIAYVFSFFFNRIFKKDFEEIEYSDLFSC